MHTSTTSRDHTASSFALTAVFFFIFYVVLELTFLFWDTAVLVSVAVASLSFRCSL
jgi:hypothetical protein